MDFKLKNINKNIVFDEPSHTYIGINGKKYESVSHVLSAYKPEFDPGGHITRRCARRDGISVEEVRKSWDKLKDDANARGHSFHRQAEHFINTGEILNEDYKDVVEQFAKISFHGKLFSEVQLHSEKFLIAGTADIIELLNSKSVNLYDFKTNKQIRLKSKYNKKLLYPLDHYDECEINNYTFQLNLYRYMLEEHGYEVGNMTLYYINPQTRLIETYHIQKLVEETNRLLKHYKAMRDW